MSAGEAVTLLAFVAGGTVFWLVSRREQSASRQTAWVVLAGLAGGTVGAKLTQLVAQGWPLSVSADAALNPQLGGRALLGGLVCGWLAVEVAKKLLGMRASTGNAFALALPAGEAVGRIGCFLNECCYGAKTNASWSVYQQGADRHPAQLYSAASAMLVFCFLLARWRRSPDVVPSTFQMYLLLFAGSRLLLEFVRHRETLVIGLSPVQWFCVEMLVVLPLTFWVARRRRTRVPA